MACGGIVGTRFVSRKSGLLRGETSLSRLVSIPCLVPDKRTNAIRQVGTTSRLAAGRDVSLRKGSGEIGALDAIVASRDRAVVAGWAKSIAVR